MNKISMIVDTTGKCKQCDEVEARIKKLLADSDATAEIEKLHYEDEEAIKLAVKYGLDNVPSFVLNSRAFNEEKFDEKIFLKALKKAKK